jgi:anti-anti-sigma regulatory factor
MTMRTCAVAVKQVPSTLSRMEERLFIRELDKVMTPGRAWVVLDCSQIRQMDRAVIYLLLCCLEEAIKRDGNVKLAAISSDARAVLKLAGVDRLFESFETNAEAIISFNQFPLVPASGAGLAGSQL